LKNPIPNKTLWSTNPKYGLLSTEASEVGLISNFIYQAEEINLKNPQEEDDRIKEEETLAKDLSAYGSLNPVEGTARFSRDDNSKSRIHSRTNSKEGNITTAKRKDKK
jgi:hypothetical protein